MSCIQQNFQSKFEPNDASYEKLDEDTFVAFILKHPVHINTLFRNYKSSCLKSEEAVPTFLYSIIRAGNYFVG